jgi:hypothetical protein
MIGGGGPCPHSQLNHGICLITEKEGAKQLVLDTIRRFDLSIFLVVTLIGLLSISHPLLPASDFSQPLVGPSKLPN